MHHRTPWICPSTHRHTHSCVYTQVRVYTDMYRIQGGHLLTPEQCSWGLVGREQCSWGLMGCASLSMPLEDLVPEARLHLSGWTSRESAFVPRTQLDLPITSRIRRLKPRPGVTVNRNRGGRCVWCVWWGNPLCSIYCPFPHSKAWPSSAAEQCAARSSRHHTPAPASSPCVLLWRQMPCWGRLLEPSLAQELIPLAQHVRKRPNSQSQPAPPF